MHPIWIKTRKFLKCFVAHHQATEVLQPSEDSINLPLSSIPPERSSVLCLGSFSTASVCRDHYNVLFSLQSFIKPAAVVILVPNESSRSFIEEHCVESLLNERYFMWRSAGHVHGDRKTSFVFHCHDLTALAILGFPHRGALFLAGTNVPSMKSSRGLYHVVHVDLQQWLKACVRILLAIASAGTCDGTFGMVDTTMACTSRERRFL